MQENSGGQALRATLNTLAEVAPECLLTQMQTEWPERYGSSLEEYRLPTTQAAQQELALRIGADGYTLLSAVYAPATPE